jgi:hypothetical protein
MSIATKPNPKSNGQINDVKNAKPIHSVPCRNEYSLPAEKPFIIPQTGNINTARPWIA